MKIDKKNERNEEYISYFPQRCFCSKEISGFKLELKINGRNLMNKSRKENMGRRRSRRLEGKRGEKKWKTVR